MIGTTAALIAGGAAAGGNILSGIFGNSAANTAARAAQYGSAAQASQLREQTDRNRADLSPFLGTGQGASLTLAHLMGISPIGPNIYSPDQQAKLSGFDAQILDLQNILNGKGSRDGTWKPGQYPHNAGTIAKLQSQIAAYQQQKTAIEAEGQKAAQAAYKPGDATGQDSTFGALNKPFTFETSGPNADQSYTFRLSQGLKALEDSAAARGTTFSGSTQKALSDYAGGSASQEYQNQYNRYTNDQTNEYNRYANLAGLGQQATSTLISANNPLIVGAANAQKEGTDEMANARQSGYASIANGIQGGIGNLIQMYLASQLGRSGQPNGLGNASFGIA